VASGLRWTAEQFEAAQRRESGNSAAAVGAAPSSPTTNSAAADRVPALGRLAQGEMNPTEEAYAAHLELLKCAGEVP
jgi:hypothetical protein